MKELFAQTAAAVIDPITYHRLVPYTEKSREAIDALKTATHLDPERLQALLDCGETMFALHEDAPFIYEEAEGMRRGVYQWINTKEQDRTRREGGMVQVSMLVNAEGKPDPESLLILYGHWFQGVLIYEKKSGPSAVLVGFPELPTIVRDNMKGVMACCKDIWEGSVFDAEPNDLNEMMHVLQDALGGCSYHAENRRKGPFVAMPA